MKSKFKRTVDCGDLEGTRIKLPNEMLLDPRGVNFKEMLLYAGKNFPDLYHKHDGRDFDQNETHWTENLLYSVKNELDNNFSCERLGYYAAIAKVVLRDKAVQLETSNTETIRKDKGTLRKESYRIQEMDIDSLCKEIIGLKEHVNKDSIRIG